MTAAQPKRPQLTIEELQQLKWLLGAVLTLLGVSTVFYMDVEAWSLMAITATATVATLARPTLPGRLPGFVHTLAFPAIVAFFAVDLWLKTEVLPAMVRLDMLLLLYRNLSYRQRRDDLQIIVLGLFLVVVAGVLTVSLMFAAHLLIYTACALALLLVVTLGESALGSASRTAPILGETPAWAAHAHWPQLLRRLREATDWRVLGLGCVLFAGVVAVSALLFLAIPRFQIENSMFLDRFITKKAKSGFSDTIRIGDVTEIQQDNSVALSVDVSDQSQIPATPYWRMLVLDQYFDGAFKLSPGLRNSEFVGAERTMATIKGYAKLQRGAAVYWTFYLESGVSRFPPLLAHFSELRFVEAQNFRFAPNLAVLQLREEPVTMTAYRVEGFEPAGAVPDKMFADEWSQRAESSTRRVILQTKVLMSRESDYGTLKGAVATVTGGTTLAAPEFARRVGDWLKKNHPYSLTPSIPRGNSDPLVRWLTSREPGHCELFAGSFVLLARTAGFAARVVTGFRGGTWNGYSNNFTIRNSDAHAWAEIFDEQSGSWLRADPLATAASTQGDDVKGEAALVSRLDRSWKARLDSLRVFWYRRVVSFDQRSQAETLKAVKEATQKTGRQLREFLGDFNAAVKDWFIRPWDVRRVFRVLMSLALLGGMIWWWRLHGRTWSARAFRWQRRRGDHPVRREASYWLARISETEARTDDAETVVTELQRLRFGATATWPDPKKAFRRARRSLREMRRQARVSRP
jgi:protein-glutamine gamma-glutamyltransferase